MEQEQKNVLNRFLADNSDLEELSDQLAAFNVFRSLKIEDVEIRHSNILEWLFKPNESHQMGDIFLRRIISNILLESSGSVKEPTSAEIELMRFTEIEVRREWEHIDLLVVDRENKFVLLIENKIHSEEGGGQLSRYKKAVDQEFPSYAIIPVFLTLEGDAIEDEEAQDFILYSYAKLLPVLGRILEHRRGQMPEDVGTFLRHYLDTLRRLTMQDQTLIDLCRKIYRNHKEAIDLVWEYGKLNNWSQTVWNTIKAAGQYKHLYSGRRRVWFAPESWMSFLPKNGSENGFELDPNISVACWFYLHSDEERIQLTFEVSAMTDPQLRIECVNALNNAGFKLGDQAFNKDARFSRFYRAIRKVVDINEDVQVREAVLSLLKDAEKDFVKAGEVLRAVFSKQSERLNK